MGGRIVLGAMLLLAGSAVAADVAMLSGRVTDAAGGPLSDALVLLSSTGTATLTTSSGEYRIPAPPSDDVLVVAAHGHAQAFVAVPSTAMAMDIGLTPAQEEPPRRVDTPFRLRVGASLPSLVGAALPGRTTIAIEPEFAAGNLTALWAGRTSLRASLYERDTGALALTETSDSPLTMILPGLHFREHPGAYDLEIAPLDSVSTGIDVTGVVATEHGPLRMKTVRERAPEVRDAAHDVLIPQMDVLSVAVLNETADAFQLRMTLANWNDQAPVTDLPAASWMVTWGDEGAEAFAVLTLDRSPGAVPRSSHVGFCDASVCGWSLAAIPASTHAGSPGTLSFIVPKGTARVAELGNSLGVLRARTFDSPAGFSNAPLSRSVIEQGTTDLTPAGAAYTLGVDEFTITPAEEAAIRDQLRAAATADSPAAPSSGIPVWIPTLFLAGAAVVGTGVYLATRRRAPPARYERLRLLGEGSAGRTYLAKHRAMGKLVALKELWPTTAADPAARERLVREARIAGALHHPNVVDVYDIEETPAGVALVMEYVDGGSLAARLAPGGSPIALPVDEALRIAREIAKGLAAIHAAGVVHRDLKPSNVLLARDGTAKVADFGVARSTGEETLGVAPTAGPAPAAGSTPIGTPLYMAPEQLVGSEPTPASDVYAATAILYRMLAGRSPFDVRGGTSWDVLLARRTQKPALPLAGAPEAVAALLAAGLAEEPEARPADGAALLAALEAAATARLSRVEPRARRSGEA